MLYFHIYNRIFSGFLKIFQYFIQHLFICRLSDCTVSEDAGIETFGQLRLRHWLADALNHSARSHPQTRLISSTTRLRSHPHSARSHPHSARSHPYSARSHSHTVPTYLTSLFMIRWESRENYYSTVEKFRETREHRKSAKYSPRSFILLSIFSPSFLSYTLCVSIFTLLLFIFLFSAWLFLYSLCFNQLQTQLSFYSIYGTRILSFRQI